MPGIERPGPLYQQVAAAIRQAISAGEFPPGSLLPSETQLIERYKVSRPTVRNAIAALRSEGLIEVIHGKGSFVRGTPAPTLTIQRTITRKGSTFTTGHDTWQQPEPAAVHRAQATTATAVLLSLEEGADLFGIDRLLIDRATGTRALHRTLIPFATAEGTTLADDPSIEPAQIYAILSEAGHKLTWSESVRARMPLPDERTSLDLPQATPVIETVRVTHGANDQPLLLEELCASGDRAQLTYRITAETPRGLHAVKA